MLSPAALATAAASFAAVAAALHAVQGEAVLEVTANDLVEAVLGLAPTTAEDTLPDDRPFGLTRFEPIPDPDSVARAELATALPTAAEMRDVAVVGPRTDAAPVPLRETTSGSRTPLLFHDLAEAPGVDWSLPGPAGSRPPPLQLVAASWDGPGIAPATVQGPRALAPSDRAASDILHPTESSVSARSAPAEAAMQAPEADPGSPVTEGGDDLSSTIETSTATKSDGVGFKPSRSDALGAIFKDAAQLLHFDKSPGPMAAPTGTSGPGATTGSFSTASTSGVEAALGGHDAYGAMAAATGLVSSAFSPSAPAVAPGIPDRAAANQPEPPSNAELLLAFTAGPGHATRVDLGALMGVLPDGVEANDARKVVVFDAPWLSVKSFMLMPGVLMVEDDLLGSAGRAEIEANGSPISLGLGDGLTLKLLGVLDVSLLPLG